MTHFLGRTIPRRGGPAALDRTKPFPVPVAQPRSAKLPRGVMLMVSRTTLGVITNTIILLFCSPWDVSTWQNQGLEISPGAVAVRKIAVRKPSPPAAGRALYSKIMREQHSRKETPCGPGCRGSKLPPLGRCLQLKDELSLPQSRVCLGEERTGERWLEMRWLGWGRPSLEDTWHPQSQETCGQHCRDATSWGHEPLEDTQEWGAITHLETVLQGHPALGTWLPGARMEPAPIVLFHSCSSAAGTPCPGDTVPWRTHGHGTHDAVMQLQQCCRSTPSWGHSSLEDTWPQQPWCCHTAAAVLQGHPFLGTQFP